MLLEMAHHSTYWILNANVTVKVRLMKTLERGAKYQRKREVREKLQQRKVIPKRSSIRIESWMMTKSSKVQTTINKKSTDRLISSGNPLTSYLSLEGFNPLTKQFWLNTVITLQAKMQSSESFTGILHS